jgi:hypothetical protein
MWSASATAQPTLSQRGCAHTGHGEVPYIHTASASPMSSENALAVMGEWVRPFGHAPLLVLSGPA